MRLLRNSILAVALLGGTAVLVGCGHDHHDHHERHYRKRPVAYHYDPHPHHRHGERGRDRDRRYDRHWDHHHDHHYHHGHWRDRRW